MTIWKDVNGYEGLYLVSRDGQIKGIKSGKILKQCVAKSGYKIVGLCSHGVRKNVQVHRIIALAFLQNSQNKPEVNHKDGCKTNNAIENLEWATRQENSQHAFENGLMNLSNIKLTPNDVKKIRKRYFLDKKTYNQIAEEFNLSLSHVEGVVLKHRWKWL